VSHSTKQSSSRWRKVSVRTVILCAFIFCTAATVRLLHWQDMHTNIPLAGMEAGSMARLLLDGNLGLFLRGPDPPNDASVLIRPPGYALLVALVFKLFGSTDAAMRIFQILCDALAAMLVFFIGRKLLPVAGAAAVAGLLVALSPQLAVYSFVLIPDSLVILPLLGVIYLLMRLSRRPRLLTAGAIGVLIGLSLWLRANTLMLAPFLAVLVLFIARRRDAAIIIAATLLVIAPITLRNWIVFHRLIPVGVGAGITLVEGIGSYDRENRFGLAASDMGVCRMEAVLYHRPDYQTRLFQPGGPSILKPDGLAREDGRLSQGWAVIRAHPFWFGGVMIRRAANMLMMERTTAVVTEPGVTHSPIIPDGAAPSWSRSAMELASVVASPSSQTRISLSSTQNLRIESSEFQPADQIVLPSIPVERDNDYLLRIPLKVERDGMTITVVSGNHGPLASQQVYQWVDTPPDEQPVSVVQIPFVSRDTSEVRIAFNSFNKKASKPILEFRNVEIFTLGPASHLWTRLPRLLIHGAQKFFQPALVIFLAVFGCVTMMWFRQWLALLIILAIPAYYLCFQSILHTDYRHVLPIYYFILMLAALAIAWMGKQAWRGGLALLRSRSAA
jgi:hypothetical protein